MGHLHEKELKKFSHLSGPLAYPGSIEITSSEAIKETQKGFFEVDLSRPEAAPNWIKLDIRPQFSVRTTTDKLEYEIHALGEKIKSFSRKPVVEIGISGDKIEPDLVQVQISNLSNLTLRCFWKAVSTTEASGSVLMRSEEHTSELQSLAYLVCRLLLEKKKHNSTLDQHVTPYVHNTHALQ